MADSDRLECEHCGQVVVGVATTVFNGDVGLALVAGYCPVCGERVRASYADATAEMRRTVHDVRRS